MSSDTLSGSSRFRMPAEWEPHAATWLAWPHRESDWPEKFSPIPWVYAEIIRTLSRFEDIHLLVADDEQQAQARETLNRAGADLNRVCFWTCPTDRSWMRDAGPIFAYDAEGQKHALDWGFNAWAKYPDWTLDDQIPARAASVRGIPTLRPLRRDWRVILEGGSIDVNGAGLLLTTEECLLSTVQHRNPPFDRADYEAVFAEYLGIRKTLWLNRGIAGDDTHGHVDDLARFVGPRTIVLVTEDDPADANHAPLRENFERLQTMTDLDGHPLEIVPLPMPRPLYHDGVRLPASYANFYIANGVVIVPTFNDPADRLALNTLASVFPDRQVIGIHSVDLVWGLGTLHCMTQQEPA
ncbi:MAG: agmatine deiminase family protein [Bacteroidales bacterium]|nr:agmatine deiminase family protein [Bacteroidales bacterium]